MDILFCRAIRTHFFSTIYLDKFFFVCVAIFHNVAHYPLSAIHIAGGDGLI